MINSPTRTFGLGCGVGHMTQPMGHRLSTNMPKTCRAQPHATSEDGTLAVSVPISERHLEAHLFGSTHNRG